MSSSRKMRRAKEKLLQKELKKNLKRAEQAMSSLPSHCDECGAHFDREQKENLDKWRVAVYDDGRLHLVCESCTPESVKNETR
ncbi:MAG: hypothetical protein VX294_04695 [Candidatus Latescibacterota bacterium]|nr:hypothetical protein [Candidatus Latescibacterota bacterium]